jgi:hypothetical protein
MSPLEWRLATSFNVQIFKPRDGQEHEHVSVVGTSDVHTETGGVNGTIAAIGMDGSIG